MDDDVLEKADSLMRRHRAFVATEAAAATTGARVPGDSDDLPVLTEVIATDESGAPPAPTFLDQGLEALVVQRIGALQRRQRELLRRELANWLDEQVPQIVMRVLDGVTDQLVAQVSSQARTTLLPRLQAALEIDTEPPQGN